MKTELPSDVVAALSASRQRLPNLPKAASALAKSARYLSLFGRIEVGWKRYADKTVHCCAVGLVDFSLLPASWARENTAPPALMHLFNLFRQTLKSCKIKFSTGNMLGGHFELSIPKADLGKMGRLVELHRSFAGTGGPFLGDVPPPWQPWAMPSLAKFEEVMAASRRLAPKVKATKTTTATPKKTASATAPKPATPKKTASPTTNKTATKTPTRRKTSTLDGALPAHLQVSYTDDLGWWLRREADRHPYRASTKGVVFSSPGEVIGFDLRTVKDPGAHSIARSPSFILDGASATARLPSLLSRCSACRSHHLAILPVDGGDQIACGGCGGMFTLDAFIAESRPHFTVEWSAHLEGKWRPGDEAILVDTAPAMLSAAGVQASTAARKVASSLALRAFSPGLAADEALLSLGDQPRLRTLRLWYSELGDRGLAELPRYSTLTEVNAGNNKGVSDAGAISLSKLPALTRLELEQTAIGDRGLAALATLPALEKLVLNSTRVTDAGLEVLRGHPTLRSIAIGWTKVTDRGLKHLATIPRLERVESWSSKNSASKKPLTRTELERL